jgi:hypothetical protein
MTLPMVKNATFATTAAARFCRRHTHFITQIKGGWFTLMDPVKNSGILNQTIFICENEILIRCIFSSGFWGSLCYVGPGLWKRPNHVN